MEILIRIHVVSKEDHNYFFFIDRIQYEIPVTVDVPGLLIKVKVKEPIGHPRIPHNNQIQVITEAVELGGKDIYQVKKSAVAEGWKLTGL